MLKPDNAALGRRWLAALMRVPEPEREGIVRAVERQIHAEYPGEQPRAGGEA